MVNGEIARKAPPKPTKTISSELSTILTSSGAAVGTGNIWRFLR